MGSEPGSINLICLERCVALCTDPHLITSHKGSCQKTGGDWLMMELHTPPELHPKSGYLRDKSSEGLEKL